MATKMREIRFRAWDKKEKKMKWVDHLSIPNFDSGAVSFLDSELKANGKYKGLGEVELMQYTGLKDKNGKEIYEGDIVVISGTKPSAHGEVKYEAPGFTVEGKNHKLNYLWKGEDIKIIGNIWENKELLK